MDINGNTNKSYKTLVLGDIHGRFIWKQIIEQEQPDRVIFIGDYFDSYDLSAAEQIHNFKEIIEYKESGKAEVILLIGNHDYHYMSGIDEHYSGYQHKSAPAINQLIEENKHHLQMVYQMDKYLFSHAGVSSEFMNNVFGLEDWQTENIATLLNEQFKYKPLTFAFGAAVLNPRLSYLELHGDRFTARKDVSHEAFDGKVREGSPHSGEVASWLHGNFKAVEEILRDDRSGLVVNHVEVPVDFRKHVNDAGPFDVDRDCSSIKINRFFLFSRISKCSKWGPVSEHVYG